ncbi:hypothetical protein [Pontimicrobium sp. SW4]|uniref:Lipoprotein n=1 Tax=Pontimicrobium sp. SW4 TaxID=3153519 RepID=A0AAU7BS01_9FLAO
MRVLILLILFSSCSSLGSFSTKTSEESSYEKVSIEQVVLNPNFYHEKQIELSGFFYKDLGYTSISEKKYSDPYESIWVDFNYKDNLLNAKNEELFKNDRLLNFSLQKIKIRGVFNKNKKGNLSAYSGSLTEITYFGSIN